MKKQLSLLAIIALGSFASCKKDDASTPTPTPTPTPSGSSTSTTPTFATGDGTIAALLTRTATASPIGPIEVEAGIGVAVFGNAGAYLDAGKITLNGTELTKQKDNAYVSTVTSANPTGIDLGKDLNWMVTTPSFTYNAGGGSGKGMPDADAISGTYTSVDVSKDFTLSVSGSITNADSVYYQINGKSKSILKKTAGTTSSVIFTAAELATLGETTTGSVTIAPWNWEVKTLGGKKINVVNEIALSRTVEIK